MTETITKVDDDPYLWLETIDGAEATRWVLDRNAETVSVLTTGARFSALREELQQVLDADDRIPLIVWHGPHVYNFWRDEIHTRGLWRRTSLASYRAAEPDWQTVLDLDALAADEGESWVWQGADFLFPDDERCLISLSRGGADAAVVREFDLVGCAFVADGFVLPEAKSGVSWIDRDHIYVGTDFGPGSLTSSGYPRVVKRWRRGTPLHEAAVVFEGEHGDVLVDVHHDPIAPGGRALAQRWVSRYHTIFHVLIDGVLTPLDVPVDAEVDMHRQWLLIRLRTAWSVGGATHPAGALLVVRLDDFLAGDRDLTPVFTPDPRTSLSYHRWTRDHLILVLLSDVRSRVEILSPAATVGAGGSAGGQWRRRVLPDDLGQTEVWDANDDHSDEFLLLSSDYTLPSVLRYGSADGGTLETLKQEPAHFDAAGLTVRQFFATSADGTQIPYFVVGRPEAGPGPTLLSGYGGFEISRVPAYNSIIGRGWLARGGTYVVANIRGGGEYGPQWHRAALRENRPRAYEDFAAVAADLVERGITTRAQLGIEGGSNGGLLMGVMLTRYPELFGAVVCQVPLLDMKRYHLLLAGASWIAEYGDPDIDADWAYLKLFSPYHNVHSGLPYPPVLIGTSTRDDRVHPGHARKMVALLREHGHDVTYYENIEGGHGGAADNAQLAFKWALAFEFLWRRLGHIS